MGAGRGATLLSGQCQELGQALPLQAVFDALGTYLRTIGPTEATRLLGSEGALLTPLLRRDTVGESTASAPVGTVADPATG